MLLHEHGAFLEPPGVVGGTESASTCLIILNYELGWYWQDLWASSSLRVAADGGLNRLHDSFAAGDDAGRARFVPDFVVGDFDSLRQDVREFYTSRGTVARHDSGQDNNDLSKCLEMVRGLQQDPLLQSSSDSPKPYQLVRRGGLKQQGTCVSGSQVEPGGESGVGTEESGQQAHGDAQQNTLFNVLVTGALGGRLDHEMANLNSGFEFEGAFRSSIAFLSPTSMACVLGPGKHTIQLGRRHHTGVCGVIPLGCPTECISTTGLKWDLDGDRMCFGGLISSSNLVVAADSCVTVDTSHPVLWTAEITP